MADVVVEPGPDQEYSRGPIELAGPDQVPPWLRQFAAYNPHRELITEDN